MEWLPLVLVLPTLCFVEAYGIQKRKRWAWYGGWIFGFFAAGVVCSYALPFFVYGETALDLIKAGLFTAGGACVWTFWAIWWAKHKDEFLRTNGPRVRS